MPACVIVGVAPPNHVTQLEDVFVILDGKVLFLFVISFTFLCPNPPSQASLSCYNIFISCISLL